MTTYRPRNLINGYKIGSQFGGMLVVALPEKKVRLGVQVIYNQAVMQITPDTPVLTSLEFEDKYGREGKYRLFYYEWRPTEQPSLI